MRRRKFPMLLAFIFVVGYITWPHHPASQRSKSDVKHSSYYRAISPQLKREIQSLIIPPSTEEQTIKHLKRSDFSQAGQSDYVDKVLGGLRDGFFVECGAGDGVALSNTLFAELERNWTGLLIEANPILFESLVSLKRHAYAMNACLSLTEQSSTVLFELNGYMGGIVTNTKTNKTRHKIVEMKCFSLTDILRSMGQLHINYLSLDVEGSELDILQTVPFDEVVIDVMTVEFYTVGSKFAREEAYRRLQEFVLGTGLYELVAILEIPNGVHEGHDVEKHVSKGLDVVFKRTV